MKWLIWSDEHDMWWSPDCNGYTFNRSEAGRYTFEEARTICEKANQPLRCNRPHEAMCPDWSGGAS
jgi:hypothetical protein